MGKLIYWWQHIPEHINPVAFRLGPVQVHYYGLMYIVAFLITYLLVMYRLKTENTGFKREIIEDYFFWLAFAVLAGGRLGYALFYNLPYYTRHPLEIVLPFNLAGGFNYTGFYGMSYHGALIGVVIVSLIFCRKNKLEFWKIADLFAPAVPLGYAFGRLGNFINGELYGRLTSVAWGMYFPLDPLHRLRHPSQLYEALLEGVLLFVVLWTIRKRVRVPGVLFALYIMGYGAVRFLLEFFRQPDPQLGLVLGPFSMGQILCFIMFAAGLGIFGFRIKNNSMAEAGPKKSK